ncbi:site-specific integrase [Rhodococcus opacus]|nr:site-specific integrase [Rhodococcus opacus]CAG7588070.1 hypothetical protein E143388_02901 [Rhodococcus opacus]
MDAVSGCTSDWFDGGEWMLYWTTRDVEVPVGFDDALDRWVDIDARERALGIDEATPILIDPVGRIDPRLARFFRRSRFAFLAEGTRQSYVKDYRLFFSFLWRRGRYWDQANYDDIGDYEAWRRRSTDNPRRVCGAKWARELAAFKLLFDWAVVTGAVERSPVATHTVRLPAAEYRRPASLDSTGLVVTFGPKMELPKALSTSHRCPAACSCGNSSRRRSTARSGRQAGGVRGSPATAAIRVLGCCCAGWPPWSGRRIRWRRSRPPCGFPGGCRFPRPPELATTWSRSERFWPRCASFHPRPSRSSIGASSPRRRRRRAPTPTKSFCASAQPRGPCSTAP